MLLGLVLGKLLGMTLFSRLAVRLRLASLPEGATWRHIAGVGLLAGIGFTVALFITELAFDDPRSVDQAKIGILAASLLAGIAGFLFFRTHSSGAIPTPAPAADLPAQPEI